MPGVVPGADTWTATVDYGDGGGGALALDGKTFALSHTYLVAGTFTVTVTVFDDDTLPPLLSSQASLAHQVEHPIRAHRALAPFRDRSR